MKRLLMVGLLVFGLGQLAFGALGLELELTDGTNTALIDSAGMLHLTGPMASGTATLSAGVYTFDGAVGNYNVNVTTGEGTPVLALGYLDLNSVDTASGSASGPLTIEFSENGIAAAFGGWQMSWGETLSSGAGATVSYSAYEDNTNAFFGTQNTIGTIGPFGPGANSGTASGSVAGVTTPYSLSEIISLNGVGSTTYSGDAGLAPVPEPASVVLFGGVVLVIATALRRRIIPQA